MKRAIALLLCSIFLLTGHNRAQAADTPTTDSLRVSLLTCGAGDAIYTLFGHTAIRIENLSRGTDVVFNYGIFDFDTPHFALRFALGETDYLLGVSDFRHFCATYRHYGRSVRQQTLNLTSSEKRRLASLLEENYRPENRQYRYNFFYDNCATRPRDLIERAVEGRIVYAHRMDTLEGKTTWRTLVHQYSAQKHWSQLGMDLCLGSKADQLITRRQMEFVPFCLEEDFQTARIMNHQGRSRPLVVATQVMVEDVPVPGHRTTNTPLWIAAVLCILVCGITLWGLRTNRTWWKVDLLLFGAAGVAGCILAFLSLFSSHPCVDSNWLLLLFHPLHLCALPFTLRRIRHKQLSHYIVVNLAALTLFIIVFLLKLQIIPPSVVLLALCLLIRSIGHLAFALKK